MQTETSI